MKNYAIFVDAKEVPVYPITSLDHARYLGEMIVETLKESFKRIAIYEITTKSFRLVLEGINEGCFSFSVPTCASVSNVVI